MWKYAPNVMGTSEYLLRTSVISMMEMDEDIFAAGNCYDARQYKNYNLFCPFAFRLPEGAILVKDLGIEYNYLSNTSDFFFNARKRAENVIKAGKSFRTSKSDSTKGRYVDWHPPTLTTHNQITRHSSCINPE